MARFLARMVLLRDHLNRTCFLSLAETECHAACYELGSFYEAHLDSRPGGNRRAISFSHYLSERGEGDFVAAFATTARAPTPSTSNRASTAWWCFAAAPSFTR